MASPSDAIRLTFPVSPDLSLRLSLLARRAERTRGWIARTLLEQIVTDAISRYADLEGCKPDEWVAGERKAFEEELRETVGSFRDRLRLVQADRAAISPGEPSQ